MSKKSSLADRLAKLADGLFLPSESDEPFVVVHWSKSDLPKDANTFRKLVGLDAKTPVKSFDAEALLERLSRESSGDGTDVKSMKTRFCKLAAFFSDNLTDIRGYKAGTVSVQTCLLGRTADGDVLGLKAGGVET